MLLLEIYEKRRQGVIELIKEAKQIITRLEQQISDTTDTREQNRLKLNLADLQQQLKEAEADLEEINRKIDQTR